MKNFIFLTALVAVVGIVAGVVLAGPTATELRPSPGQYVEQGTETPVFLTVSDNRMQVTMDGKIFEYNPSPPESVGKAVYDFPTPSTSTDRLRFKREEPPEPETYKVEYWINGKLQWTKTIVKKP
jgi:hypothetical protein